MTRFIRSFFVAVSLLCAATWASALVPVQSGYRVDGIAGGPFSTEAAACANALSVLRASNPTYTYRDAGITQYHQCNFWYKNSPGANEQNVLYLISTTPVACPANSTAVTGGCQCNTNYDDSGGQCVPHVNQCTAKAGKVGVTGWTQGFSRTPDEGDVQAVGAVNRPPADGVICDAGCSVSIQMAGPGVTYYVSQSPTANGLYRRSVDYPNIGLGTECTPQAKDAAAQKNTAAPACPGTVGEVNGKTTCVGTTSSPVPTTPGDVPPVTPIAGNPAAGAKPTTGDGSGTGGAGRTPATGDGGNAGGPAGAAAGGKGGGAGGTGSGTGTHTNGDGKEEADPCGAPGQPLCNVKVDETGVPTSGGTAFDAAKKLVDDSATNTEQKINAARDRTDGPAWSFSFALPTGCSPYPVGFGGVVLNVCQYQGTIHDLLSMVWAAVTLFTIIGMVGRTIRGT